MPMREVRLRRWEIAAAFLALAIAFTFGLWKVQHDSASIGQLQRTNCSLKQFLLTAEQARLRASARETGLRQRQDLASARGYRDLANRFKDGAVGPHCVIPLITIPGD